MLASTKTDTSSLSFVRSPKKNDKSIGKKMKFVDFRTLRDFRFVNIREVSETFYVRNVAAHASGDMQRTNREKAHLDMMAAMSTNLLRKIDSKLNNE